MSTGTVLWQNSFNNISDFPIAFPKLGKRSESRLCVLAADIGGTKTNLGLFFLEDGQISLVEQATYASGDYNSFSDIAREFLKDKSSPDRLSIGIAGPVIDGRATTTNLGWELDRRVLIKDFAIPDVYILNDLEANAYGIAALKEEDLLRLYAGKPEIEGNAAIIAPGTGLGEAGLYWDGKAYHPFATEGGHTDFGPHSDQDIALFRYLRSKFGHVSWERVVSGPGILNIFNFLQTEMGREVPTELEEDMKKGDAPAVISKYAQKGYPICVETIDLFMIYLAQEAANLCLKMKAVGGLFIGGGIPPKLQHEFFEEQFLHHFFDAGRMRSLLETIPVTIIVNSETALLGAAYYGALS
jgi:glucokinase